VATFCTNTCFHISIYFYTVCVRARLFGLPDCEKLPARRNELQQNSFETVSKLFFVLFQFHFVVLTVLPRARRGPFLRTWILLKPSLLFCRLFRSFRRLYFLTRWPPLFVACVEIVVALTVLTWCFKAFSFRSACRLIVLVAEKTFTLWQGASVYQSLGLGERSLVVFTIWGVFFFKISAYLGEPCRETRIIFTVWGAPISASAASPTGWTHSAPLSLLTMRKEGRGHKEEKI